MGAEPTKGLVCAGAQHRGLQLCAELNAQEWDLWQQGGKNESHVQASAYKKQLCIYVFFFFLLTKLILTLSRHIVWNPGLSLFPHEHPTTIQRIHTIHGFLSAPGSLVVRTTAEHISIYAVKAFGSEDFNRSTSFSVIAGMRSISLPTYHKHITYFSQNQSRFWSNSCGFPALLSTTQPFWSHNGLILSIKAFCF